MCGVTAIFSHQEVNQALYDALIALQHRGQDASGIMTSENGLLHLRKGNGMVRDVFHTRHMLRLSGNMGIGHVRYPTAGTASDAEAQPFYVNSPYGICLAHNGNLINAEQLTEEIYQSDLRHLNTSSDSEVLLNVLASELQRLGKINPTADNIFAACSVMFRRCKGAYAAVAMFPSHGILAFRDPNGIRPLVYGRRKSEKGYDYMFASESVALDALGFENITDVAPGEAIFVDMTGQLHQQQCVQATNLSPCIFEYVYLARSDSVIDNISVYRTRMMMGEKLAEKIKREYTNLAIDVVIPVPDTSRTAANQLAKLLNIEYREGFVKNRYIGRTFIMPGQLQRKKSVQQKLNPIKTEFDGKNVLLVDDSIVRGTTCQEIISMVKRAGAKKVYFASAAPPIRYPNVYGIDIPATEELIANNRTIQQICENIGADALIYQDIDDLVQALQACDTEIEQFEMSVFSGEYITGDVNQTLLKTIAAKRNDTAKLARSSANNLINLMSYD